MLLFYMLQSSMTSLFSVSSLCLRVGVTCTNAWGFPAGSAVKNLQVWSLGWEDPLEEGMLAHSTILAWRRKEKPGRL